MTAHRYDMPTRTPHERSFLEELERTARASQTTNVERFCNFTVWAPRQNVARFLAQAEVYREHILPTHGSIVECGVAFGAGLGAWQHLIATYEPVNHTRRVIGFDTFEGFPHIAKEDEASKSGLAFVGGMAAPVYDELHHLFLVHDSNRAVGHIPRVELVKGDATRTIIDYVGKNKHLVVAALVLDFDLYQPTHVAIESFLPLMPLGGVVIFDELNCADWPGETQAALMSGLLRRGKLRRSPLTSTMSYLVIE